MITDVTRTSDVWTTSPWKYEAGTPDIADGIAFGVGLLWFIDLIKWLGGDTYPSIYVNDYFTRLLDFNSKTVKLTKSYENGFKYLVEYEHYLVDKLMHNLSNIDGLSIFGPTDSKKRVGVVSFTTDCLHPHDLASLLDEKGIAIRAGMHCAHPLHKRFGLDATARISLGIYNTEQEVDYVSNVIKECISQFS